MFHVYRHIGRLLDVAICFFSEKLMLATAMQSSEWTTVPKRGSQDGHGLHPVVDVLIPHVTLYSQN